MKIGLYFGSFNPVHIGHLIIANFVTNSTDIDQVWLVVSPHNPLKHSASLLNEYHRLHLVNISIEGNKKLKASDVEFKLPRPSYTIDTLSYLKEKYPAFTFTVIIGSDSFLNIAKWKNYKALLNNNQVMVYERPNYPIKNTAELSITVLKAPLLDISSTFIRALVKSGKSIQYLVSERVKEEIESNGYYRL